ncbi:hypothetical protein [Enorma massiliensis]|uniref:hypothetical protein n=1 Tax=Enorma massiliensis TaxID=1472761 RepID=UPI003A959157
MIDLIDASLFVVHVVEQLLALVKEHALRFAEAPFLARARRARRQRGIALCSLKAAAQII